MSMILGQLHLTCKRQENGNTKYSWSTLFLRVLYYGVKLRLSLSLSLSLGRTRSGATEKKCKGKEFQLREAKGDDEETSIIWVFTF
jgi:hypothetical protein